MKQRKVDERQFYKQCLERCPLSAEQRKAQRKGITCKTCPIRPEPITIPDICVALKEAITQLEEATSTMDLAKTEVLRFGEEITELIAERDALRKRLAAYENCPVCGKKLQANGDCSDCAGDRMKRRT